MNRALLGTCFLSAFVAPAAITLADPAGGPGPKAEPTPKAIDPRADRVLRDMSSYLSSLKSFEVNSEATDELVLTNGSKIQVVTTNDIVVRRPNALTSRQVGPSGRMMAWYDGKDLSVYCKSLNTYGTVPAPPTLDGMLDMARKKYGIEAPGSDLVYRNPYEVLTENAKSGQYLGLEDIDGVPSHHLAFQEGDVDWQIWVQQGPEPRPLRYVITSKTMNAQPEFTAHLTKWKTPASVPDAAFAFEPPAGAKRVEGLPNTCPATR
jgi:hypothetical protein